MANTTGRPTTRTDPPLKATSIHPSISLQLSQKCQTSLCDLWYILAYWSCSPYENWFPGCYPFIKTIPDWASLDCRRVNLHPSDCLLTSPWDWPCWCKIMTCCLLNFTIFLKFGIIHINRHLVSEAHATFVCNAETRLALMWQPFFYSRHEIAMTSIQFHSL